MFDAMVVGATIRELTAEGLLVPSVVLAPPQATADLWMAPVAAYEAHARGTPAVVFCSSVEHARAVASEFSAAGYRAACIDGEMAPRDRDAALERFAAGDLDVLTNVYCLTEGWDAPRAATCILARSCGHAGTFLQMVGRVLRPAPGKSIATVIDLRGVVYDVGLPDEERVWSLEGDAVRCAEQLPSLRRCAECFAIYRPAATCPRCGASATRATVLPRVLNRAERLDRVSDLRQDERDARYLARLEGVARTRIRMPDWRARDWAATQFRKRFGREPARRAA
jgi:superfamily II DNA or RNA helicase